MPIANDGTVHLRQRERIYFSYLITLKPTGTPGRIKARGKGRGVAGVRKVSVAGLGAAGRGGGTKN